MRYFDLGKEFYVIYELSEEYDPDGYSGAGLWIYVEASRLVWTASPVLLGGDRSLQKKHVNPGASFWVYSPVHTRIGSSQVLINAGVRPVGVNRTGFANFDQLIGRRFDTRRWGCPSMAPGCDESDCSDGPGRVGPNSRR